MRSARTRLAVVVLAGSGVAAGGLSAGAASEAEAVPRYGARDFVPTPAVPIGFRADGNGWYPGAEPPAEWWEGTPAYREMRTAGNDGVINTNDKKSAQIVLGDRRSKNVRWKSPIPGWGDAQPIIVGKRVITLSDPHFVVCYEADTGKELWRDALEVMTLPVLGKDRRTLEPAPERGRQQQAIWELTRAMLYMQTWFPGGKKGPTDAEWEALKPTLELCRTRLGEWRKILESNQAEAPILKGFDEVVAGVQNLLASTDADGRQKAANRLGGSFPQAVNRAYRVPVHYCWHGHVGGTFSTPVSDGEIVFVCIGYGQFAAYDAATGKRRWAFRDSLAPSTFHMNHGPSPIMWKNSILVRSADGQAVMSLDKATGAVQWETATQKQARGSGANHGNYVNHVLMDVPVAGSAGSPQAGGGRKTVVVCNEPPILDPATGEILGRLEIGGPKKRSDRGTMIGRDGRLFTGWGYDAAPSPTYVFNLWMEGGKVAVSHAGNLVGRGLGGDTPGLYRPDHLIGGFPGVYDPRNLTLLSDPKGPSGEGAPSVLAGDLLIARGGQNSFNRTREDFAVTVAFAVADARDPSVVRTLSTRNVLGDDSLPADSIFDTYMKGFNKRRNIGCYKGIAPWFGCRVGGVVPKGDRLYIQSSVGMYCIAPEARGSLRDDPKVLAAIAAAGEVAPLAPHLAADAVRHRLEAVRRLGALRKALPADVAAALSGMAIQDPYEEVRAAAVETLDACDSAGSAGWNALAPELAAANKGHMWWVAPTVDRWRACVLTFRVMGDAGLGLIRSHLPQEANPELQAALFGIANTLAWKDGAIITAAMATLGQRNSAALSYLCNTAWSDPRVLAELRKRWAESDMIVSTLSGRLPETDLPAFLAEVAAAHGKSGNPRTETFEQGARRAGAAGIAALEKAADAAADGRGKDGLKGLIAKLREPPLNPLPGATGGVEKPGAVKP